MAAKFEISKDHAGKFRFHLKAPNPAMINRRLVGAGISVYGLQQTRASLEEWFLSVTTRLGEHP